MRTVLIIIICSVQLYSQGIVEGYNYKGFKSAYAICESVTCSNVVVYSDIELADSIGVLPMYSKVEILDYIDVLYYRSGMRIKYNSGQIGFVQITDIPVYHVKFQGYEIFVTTKRKDNFYNQLVLVRQGYEVDTVELSEFLYCGDGGDLVNGIELGFQWKKNQTDGSILVLSDSNAPCCEERRIAIIPLELSSENVVFEGREFSCKDVKMKYDYELSKDNKSISVIINYENYDLPDSNYTRIEKIKIE